MLATIETEMTPIEAAWAAIPGDTFDAAKARALMVGYDARWRQEDWICVASEQQFNIPICNPDSTGQSRTFTHAGKKDGIVRKPNSGEYLREHKTTIEKIDDFSSAFWARLSIDSQTSGYTLEHWLEGKKLAGTLYDVLHRPTLRPKKVPMGGAECKKIVGKSKQGFGDQRELEEGTYYRTQVETGVVDFETQELMLARLATQEADKTFGTLAEILLHSAYFGRATTDRPDSEGVETPYLYMLRLIHEITQNPEQYFQRRIVPRMDSDLIEYAHELWQVANDIREARRLGFWYRNTGACHNFNRICQYLPLCAGESALDGQEWEHCEEVHRELEGIGNDALTNSRIRRFQTCRRKDYYRSELRIQRRDSEESEALRFGALLHQALEAWWNCFRAPEPII